MPADERLVDVTSTPGATTALDAPPGQAQIMVLRDALALERTQGAALLQTMPQPRRRPRSSRARAPRSTPTRSSAVVAADEHAAVVAAEPDRVRHRDPDIGRPRALDHVVEVALGVGLAVVQRRR